MDDFAFFLLLFAFELPKSGSAVAIVDELEDTSAFPPFWDLVPDSKAFFDVVDVVDIVDFDDVVVDVDVESDENGPENEWLL
jgi:hypothetical protein